MLILYRVQLARIILNLINTANEAKVRAEADMDNALKILDELKKDSAGKQPSGLEITFSQEDTRLSVIEAGGNILTGSLELEDGGPTEVVGVPVPRRFDGIRRKGAPTCPHIRPPIS